MASVGSVQKPMPVPLAGERLAGERQHVGMRVSFVRGRFSRYAVVVALTVGLPFAYLCYLIATDDRKDPARVAFIMNIRELPRSVRDIECSATAITDLIVTCAFRIDSDDFQSLVSGWQFTSNSVSGDGRDYGTDAKVGPSFEAALRYSVYPESFKRGGRVDLVTNIDQTLVVANRYEE